MQVGSRANRQDEDDRPGIGRSPRRQTVGEQQVNYRVVFSEDVRGDHALEPMDVQTDDDEGADIPNTLGDRGNSAVGINVGSAAFDPGPVPASVTPPVSSLSGSAPPRTSLLETPFRVAGFIHHVGDHCDDDELD